MRQKDNTGCCIMLIIAIIMLAIYCTGGYAIYKLGYKRGQTDRVSRAVCMSHIIDLEQEGRIVKWTKNLK